MKAQRVLAILFTGGIHLATTLPGQGLAGKLRAGDAASVTAAAAALDVPAEADVDGLLRLVQAGRSSDGSRGVAGELAFAVVGWWSMQDVAIANGLYDRVESGAWAETAGDLLWLAILGAGKGAEQARSWIAKDAAGWRRSGWWLLRNVGAEDDFVSSCVEQALGSEAEADQRLGMQLMWEFEMASEPWTKRLEAIHAEAHEELTRWAALWAMVRGGGFRTQWMLGIREGLPRQADKAWFDSLFERMVPAAAARLLRELANLGPAERARVICWLGGHLHDPSLRRALLATGLDAAESCRVLAPLLAKSALGEADLLPFWVRCLTAEPRQQRLACLALANLGEAAAPHAASIARLLAVEPKPRRVAKDDLRASAIHALGAIGPAAREYLDQIAAFGSSDDELVAAAAAWALPRLRGETGPGPWRAAPARPRAFETRELLFLRQPDSALLRAVPNWPEATRRLALPRLLIALLDERPSPPPEYMAVGGGMRSPMEQLVEVDDSERIVPMRKISVPERISWHLACALRVDAVQSIGPAAKVAEPLLQWLAPRRPHLGRLVASLR